MKNDYKNQLSKIDLESIKLRGWDYAEDSVIITAKRKKWDGKKESTPIIYVNPAFERMTGYTKKEVIGKDPRIFQGKKTDQAVVERIRKSLKKGSIFRGETYNYKKDGTPFLMNWHIEPILDKQGKIVSYIAIQQDVTEIRHLEEDQRKLEAIKTTFVKLVSHQMRTPLSTIRWNLEILLENKLSDEIKELLNVSLLAISKMSTRVSILISSLDETKNNDGIKLVPLSLDELFLAVDVELKNLQQEKNVKFIFPKKIGLSVMGERDILLNALLSCVSNSIFYSKPGKKVIVSVVKKKNNVSILIKDNGMGISKQDSSIIFSPFQRGSQAEKYWPDGFGVELWVAKRNLASINSSITLTSDGKNKGATCTINVGC